MFAKLDFAKLDEMDALDLAILVEMEAFERYEAFANQLGHSGPDDAGNVFRMMAVMEGKHGQSLADRRKAMFGDKPMRVNKDMIYDVEAPDVGAIRWNMSQLKAYQVALASEKKAYDYYDMAMPYVSSDETRELFRTLRDEETGHVKLLENAIAKLPPSAAEELEDLDD